MAPVSSQAASTCFLLLFFVSFLSISVHAESTNVIIDSKNWKDVYAGTLYAQWSGQEFYFVNGVPHANVLPGQIRYRLPVVLLESDNPFAVNYKNTLEQRGFSVKEVLEKPGDLTWSQALGQRVNATRFVVLDGAFGYNAVSVVSYALRENAWVLFAEDFTADGLKNYLRTQKAAHVLQYGALPEDKRLALAGFNPETIDRGDRFSNNVALLDRLLAKQPAAQLTLANGEFIERNLIDGPARDPVLLVGTGNLPSVSAEFLRKNSIAYGVLIGSEQSDLARWIKQHTPMKYIYVKFAQTFIQKGTAVTEPWALTYFYLPRLALNVTIQTIQYNQKTNVLEVVYRNQESTRTYLQGRADVYIGNVSSQNVQDDGVTVLEAQATQTASYPLRIDEKLFSTDVNLSVEVTGNYGEEPGALERRVTQRAENLAVVSFSDESALQLGPLVYDSSRQGFDLEIINSGPVTAYFEPHLRFSVSNQTQSLTTKNTVIAAGTSQKVFFHSPFSKEQVSNLNGAVVSVLVNYGARESFLTKSIAEDRLFSLSAASNGSSSQNSVDWTLVGIVGLVVGAGVLYFTRQKGSSGGFSARRRF